MFRCEPRRLILSTLDVQCHARGHWSLWNLPRPLLRDIINDAGLASRERERYSSLSNEDVRLRCLEKKWYPKLERIACLPLAESL
jgi:hypothetical protein